MNDGLVWREVPIPEEVELAMAELAWANDLSTDEVIVRSCQLVGAHPSLLNLKEHPEYKKTTTPTGAFVPERQLKYKDHVPDHEERLKDDLLRVLLKRFPGSKGLALYERGILCPTEAANVIFDELTSQTPSTDHHGSG